MPQKQPNPPPIGRRPEPPPKPPGRKATTLWVTGKHRGKLDDGSPAWDLQGVFDSEAAAVAACESVRDFIGPVPLNQRLPQGATEWPHCRYPLAQG